MKGNNIIKYKIEYACFSARRLRVHLMYKHPDMGAEEVRKLTEVFKRCKVLSVSVLE